MPIPFTNLVFWFQYSLKISFKWFTKERNQFSVAENHNKCFTVVFEVSSFVGNIVFVFQLTLKLTQLTSPDF